MATKYTAETGGKRGASTQRGWVLPERWRLASSRRIFTKVALDPLAKFVLLDPVWPSLGEHPARMQRVPGRLHLATSSFSPTWFPAGSVNAEAIHNAVPKWSVVPNEESLGERNPYVIDNQIPAPEISDMEVGSSLY